MKAADTQNNKLVQWQWPIYVNIIWFKISHKSVYAVVVLEHQHGLINNECTKFEKQNKLNCWCMNRNGDLDVINTSFLQTISYFGKTFIIFGNLRYNSN